ncbi:hypothetical protein F2P56_036059, partial [Juglans regia]
SFCSECFDFLLFVKFLGIFVSKFLGEGVLLFLVGLFSASLLRLSAMASSAVNRWLRPEVYPLFAAVGVAVGICGMQLVRNICTNPEVRVIKEKRAAGVLENFEEGEKYKEHGLRKFVRNKSPEIMPSVNKFFSNPN